MNKIYSFFTVLLVLLSTTAIGQSWTVYEADVLPNEFSTPFSTTQQSGTFSNQLVVDPDNAANSLLHMTTLAITDNNQWLQNTTETAVTMVVKARSLDIVNKNLVFDFDIRNSTVGRFAFQIRANGDLSISQGGTGTTPLGIDLTAWHIYRITKTGQSVAVYIDENATPAFTATSTSTSDGSNYIRFGDGWGSGNIDTQFDWVTWDFTGAYSPTDSPLPAQLVDTPESDNWVIYQADVEPLSFDPAFEASNQSGTFSNQIVEDAENAGNNLLQITTDVAGGNSQWRQQVGAVTAMTVVFKARGLDPTRPLLFDADFDFNGFRSQIRILPNGNLSVANGTADATPDPLIVDTQDWNIYRFTRDGNLFALYVNEETTPVVTGTAATAGANNFFRFGDGWGSGTINTQFDWVTWDITGAYSPDEQALPEVLTQAPLGDWTVYEADVAPLDFTPPFEITQQTNAINEIIVDPEDGNNNLLRMATVLLADNNQWRQPTTATDVTLVIKAKSNDAVGRNLLFDVDIRNGAVGRYSLRVLNDGTYSVASGGAGTGTLGHNPSEWTIYRFTKSGQEFAVYLNEDPTPVFTVTSTSTSDGTNNYVRFGDGWGSGNMDTNIDWVVWDFSGAYSPSDTRLPDYLTGGEVELVPSLSAFGNLDPLSQDLGFATDFTVDSYTVSGRDLIDGITITPPINFEVSLNEVDWFTNANPLVIAQVDGEVGTTSVFVRLNATEVGDYSGDILHSSTGAEANTVAVSGTTINLIPELSLIGALNPFTQNISNPSASQNYRVSGLNLKGAITVTAPADFQVSSDNSNWLSEITLEPTSGRTITNALVYVRLSAGSLGNYSGTISHTATDAEAVSLGVLGEVIPDPGINVTSAFTSFSSSIGVPSAPQSYTVSGSNLASGIAITLPEGYEISFTGDFWLNSLTLVPLDGNVQSITLFIRLNAATEGTKNGNIVHASTGLTNVLASVTGTTTSLALSASPTDALMNIWPNPTSNTLTFERKDYANNGKVTVYSVEGAQISVFSIQSGNTQIEMDVHTLPKGLYIMEYASGANVIRQKFMKN